MGHQLNISDTFFDLFQKSNTLGTNRSKKQHPPLSVFLLSLGAFGHEIGPAHHLAGEGPVLPLGALEHKAQPSRAVLEVGLDGRVHYGFLFRLVVLAHQLQGQGIDGGLEVEK